MSIGAFIIARLSSTRLPAKNIMEILDKPMIEHMIERVSAAQKVDKVVIATSSESSDDPLEELAEKLGVGCYRGSLDNVMERICGAASAFGCETIVELLGDNPLVHSDLIDDVIELFVKEDLDYAATVTKEYQATRHRLFSVGVRVQVYTNEAAQRYTEYPDYIEDESKGSSAYIFENPQEFKVGYLEAAGKWSFMNRPELNFAVNYRHNFEAVRSIFEACYPDDNNFPLQNVYSKLDVDRYLYQLIG